MGEATMPGAGAGLQTVHQREQALLAPYAMRSRDSRGRRHYEPPHNYRGPFQRDRDRVLHSSAFRRLSGKMQVFTGERGDYHRTRLTHTHEVASIARTIGRALRLNEDLIEAMALFHDIGHPPFGHAGEDALNDRLADHGGFSHNRYALTIAEELESCYPQFSGLNLSLEVLEGQQWRSHKDETAAPRLLEVQVVDAADSITYNAHDVDDAVKLGLVDMDELSTAPLAGEVLEAARRRLGPTDGAPLRKAVVHDLIDRQVSDLLAASSERLRDADFPDSNAARESPPVIDVSAELNEQKRELESFLYQRVYRHGDLLIMRQEAQKRLTELFMVLADRPELLPEHFQRRAESHGLERAIGDYLAGMTDRFCDQMHREWCVEPGS